MKKLLCILMSVTLLLLPVLGLAADYDSLLQKASNQIDKGSGLKGSIVLNISGEAEWAELLGGLNGTDIEVRHIRSGNVYQTLLYLTTDEAQHGLTQVDTTPEDVTLTSRLLPGRALTMERASGSPASLLAMSSENPEALSAIWNILSLPQSAKAAWEKALDPYYRQLEEWMNSFGSAPEVVNTDGTRSLRVRYEIPAAAVKTEMKELLRQALEDETLKALLAEQMTAEQQALYLNPYLMYYYEPVINGLELPSSLVLEREISARGDDVSSTVTFPLPELGQGLRRLTVYREALLTRVTVETEEQSVMFELSDATVVSSIRNGRLRITPTALSEDNEAISLSFVYQRDLSESVDNERREHAYYTWSLTAENDWTDVPDGQRGYYLELPPVSVKVNLHAYSKNANMSPTTMQFDVDFALPNAKAPPPPPSRRPTRGCFSRSPPAASSWKA